MSSASATDGCIAENSRDRSDCDKALLRAYCVGKNWDEFQRILTSSSIEGEDVMCVLISAVSNKCPQCIAQELVKRCADLKSRSVLNRALAIFIEVDEIRALLDAGARVGPEDVEVALEHCIDDRVPELVLERLGPEHSFTGILKSKPLRENGYIRANYVELLLHAGADPRELSAFDKMYMFMMFAKTDIVYNRYADLYALYRLAFELRVLVQLKQPIHIIEEIVLCAWTDRIASRVFGTRLNTAFASLTDVQRLRTVVSACNRTCKTRRALCMAVFPTIEERLSGINAALNVGAEAARARAEAARAERRKRNREDSDESSD
jgi:hypothetical protein